VKPPASHPTPSIPGRVSTLELFFDLVFVFTITQLTSVLAAHLTVLTGLRVMLMLAVILWMYGGYAWLTNAVAPTTRFRRSLVLVGMGGFLAISLAIPDAFGGTGWLFGLGYFVVNAVHSGLFVVSGGPDAARTMLKGVGPPNLVVATLVLVGGFLPVPWRVGLWLLGVVIVVVVPYVSPIGGFNITPSHFVERHGLLIIIALGESIVAIGAGVVGQHIDLFLVIVAVLGLSVSYLMWWVYFGGDDTLAERALGSVEPARRGRAAIEAYGWAHYFLLLGIVFAAAGVKKAVSHPLGHVTLAQALVLAGGVSLYLLGDVWFRRVLRIGQLRFRAIGAMVVLATVPLGLVYAVAELVALNVLLMAMLYREDRAGSRRRGLADEVEQPAT
jgi:low temperature requirement protein LtrA